MDNLKCFTAVFSYISGRLAGTSALIFILSFSSIHLSKRCHIYKTCGGGKFRHGVKKMQEMFI